MRKNKFRKGLVVAVIVLFVGAGVSSINGVNIKSTGDIPRELSGSENWWNFNWSYRKEITINHAMVDGNLLNFPVLIYNISSDFATHAQPDGDDFVFIDDTNTYRYYHEIEYYDDAIGELVAWVNVTSLSFSEDPMLYAYFGNSTCGSQQTPENVWDSNYMMVQHMNDNTSNSIKDSTFYNNDGMKKDTNEPSETSGKISMAQNFDGTDDYIDLGLPPEIDRMSTYTLEAWAKFDSIASGDDNGILWLDHDWSTSDRQWYMDTNDGDFLYTNRHNGGTDYLYGGAATTDTWYYVVGRFDGTNAKIFINGVEKDSDPGGSPVETGGSCRIGGTYSYMDGTIDEIRIANIARDDSWISTTYNNQNSPESFIIVGVIEYAYPPIANFTYAPENPKTHDIIQFNDTSFDENGEIVTWWWDFDDGYYSDLQNPIHQYFEGGVYNVSLKVTDDEGGTDTVQKSIPVIVLNDPPYVPDISGPINGTAGVKYEYTFNATDPDGDDVKYIIDWGDGNGEETDFHASGTPVTASHTWSKTDSYTITAKAKDVYGAESDWGTLEVTMPKNKPFFFNSPLLSWLFERFPNMFPILRHILGS